MSKKEIKLEIPGLPKMFNQYKNMHWAAKAKHVNQWKLMVGIFLLQTNQRPRVPFKKAKIKITRHSSSPPDFDNLAQSAKPLLDGLVEAKVIVDDSMAVIGQPEYKWQKAKPTAGKITIQIWGDE